MYFKKMFKCLLCFLSVLLILNFILTLFGYFNIFKSNLVNVLKYIILFMSFLITGYYIGFNSNNKGYIEGIKIGSIISIILIIINIIFNDFKFIYLIYYVLLIVTSTMGSMLGINTRKK